MPQDYERRDEVGSPDDGHGQAPPVEFIEPQHPTQEDKQWTS